MTVNRWAIKPTCDQAIAWQINNIQFARQHVKKLVGFIQGSYTKAKQSEKKQGHTDKKKSVFHIKKVLVDTEQEIFGGYVPRNIPGAGYI